MTRSATETEAADRDKPSAPSSMNAKLWFKLVVLLTVYGLCSAVWSAEQILGLGRNFIYAIF